MQTWIVSSPDRLDAFLAQDGRMISRAKAQKAIEAGLVKVNGEKVKHVSERLQEGDQVTLVAPLPVAGGDIVPADLSLEVLYEDDACLVIDKPAGYAVHPGAGMAPDEKTILHGIAHLFKKRKIPFSSEGVLAHRLDKETTGCLLIAKTPEAHKVLQKQFEERSIGKQYLALVAGLPVHQRAVVDSPIGRSAADRTKMSVQSTAGAREAQTEYRTLANGNECALLLCDLYTGRTHQIRVHLSALGHPVLGDSTYVNALAERLRDQHEINILCLHAWKLTFTSPFDSKEHAVEAAPSAAYLRVLRDCGVNWSPSETKPKAKAKVKKPSAR